MRFAIVAGTPGSGKTAVLIQSLKHLIENDINPSIVKIDCLYSDDERRFAKLGVPTKVGLSKDMCPDHFSIYNLENMINWASKHNSDYLVVETAGLCHRCSPYTIKCQGICIIDATSGPNTPRKVGPFLSTADIVVVTKGDIISQAEREIFRDRVIEMNPFGKILEVNALSGQGCAELAEEMMFAENISLNCEELRHSAPLAVCTLCVGETRIKTEHHRGILRKIDSFQKYIGE